MRQNMIGEKKSSREASMTIRPEEKKKAQQPSEGAYEESE